VHPLQAAAGRESVTWGCGYATLASMPRANPALSSTGFDEMALFVDIAESGSITAAARRLGLPKSTVSRALTRLEVDLGVALVRRSARGPILTDQGIELARMVSAHVVAIRDAALALGTTEAEPYGTVRITAPIDLGERILGPLLPAFLARYPRVRVEVEISQRFVDVIGEGVDLALRVSRKPLPTSSLRGRKLGTANLGLYASPTYMKQVGRVQHPDDLVRCEHVVFRAVRGTAQLSLDGPSGSSNLSVVGRLGCDDFYVVRAALLAGVGIGTLPWFMAQAEIDSGRLVRVLPRYSLRGATVYLLHAPVRPLPRKVDLLRDYLIEYAPRVLTQ